MQQLYVGLGVLDEQPLAAQIVADLRKDRRQRLLRSPLTLCKFLGCQVVAIIKSLCHGMGRLMHLRDPRRVLVPVAPCDQEADFAQEQAKHDVGSKIGGGA